MDGKKIRSAKRSKNERMGLHSWHSYYAGYSEAVVEDLLTYFGTDSSSKVLDPWMGSGTTAIVCQKKNIPIVGREINPVMVKFSKGKTAKLLDYNLENLAKQIIDNSNNIVPILDITVPDIIVQEITSEERYLKLKAIEKSINDIIDSIEYHMEKREILISFYYSALFQILRAIGKFKKGSNPTWIKRLKLNENEVHNIDELFLKTVLVMINDLKENYKGIDRNNIPDIKLGNSKKLDLVDNSVNFIITSPPYLTRIDYVVSTKPELLFLGLDEKVEVDVLRRDTMGAPIIRKELPAIDKCWGKTCISFLEQVRVHNSKASNSYYLKNFLQYFDDAFKSLQEIKRVLKVDGKAALVVQTSYFKEIEIELTKMYVEMGENLGLKSSILKREVVKQHMAHINVKSSQYVAKKLYYEDIILYEKGEKLMEEKESVALSYSDHRSQVENVQGLQERLSKLNKAVVEGFKDYLVTRETYFINFKDMTAEELANVFYKYPIVIKSVLTSVNVAGRAIKRDLEITIDTYKLSITKKKAGILAGYIKPMLPSEISIDALCELDRWFYVDKEIRKSKGSWEKEILKALIKFSNKEFKKRKFVVDGQKFELDAAYPATANIVETGVDVKRIEARQDIHKRADEIVNKASKYKKMFPDGKFFAVIYYPFTADHINLKERLASKDIDGIYFANENTLSIEQQAKYLLGKAQLLEIEDEEIEE
ncbi:DNA methyltransferase [Wukongibacter sp. M2B1]|uniref:DNA methyltransferase n=1 Tax=Wukongibacter sp. M2B1 TaxID=3088895 RepID=UPI003D799973